MIVMKFGGTSLENAASYTVALQLVTRQRDRRPVVVLSAIAGATNTLLQAAQHSVEGRHEEAIASLNALLERHVLILENVVGTRSTVQQLIFELRRSFDELKSLCHAIAILGELTDRSLDAIGSVGERLSTAIFAAALAERDIETRLVDARSFMITDNRFTGASPIMDAVALQIKNNITPILDSGAVIVTQGFVGSTLNGVTTTLGRGGSDFSAAIIGAALEAEEIQIWTDVDGILTADPRICPDAKRLKVISFREASELAYFGAKVLHPSTILPAVQKNIPVSVLNSRKPDAGGTLIVENPPRTNIPVKSIASKKSITVISIVSTRMLMAYGFLERIFSVFSHHKTPVDLVTTSEVAVSLTIDDTEHLEAIVEDLRRVADVTVFPKKAIVCIIGDQMKSTAGVADRVFRSLRDINVMMISQGASEINMSIVVDEDRVTEAVQSLHHEFFQEIPATEVFDSST